MEDNTHLITELESQLSKGDIFAAHRLAQLQSPAATQTLLQHLPASRGVLRRAIIQALPLVPEIEVTLTDELEAHRVSTNGLDALYDTMADMDIVLKLSALKTPAAVDAIRRWTRTTLERGDEDRYIAFEGILSLSKNGDMTSLSLFRECLNSDQLELRSAAIYALGELRDIESVPRLIDLLSDKAEDPLESETLICDGAATALGSIGDERAIEPMVQLVVNRATGPHPNRVLTALGRLSETGFDILLTLLSHSDAKLVADVAYSLGMVANRRAVEPLIEILLKDHDETVHRYAIEALRLLHDERAIEPLLHIFQKSPQHRNTAAYAMGKFRDERVTNALIEMLSDNHANNRYSAAFLLGSRKDVKAVAHLIERLYDEERNWLKQKVCDAVATALQEIGSPEAISALQTWRNQ